MKKILLTSIIGILLLASFVSADLGKPIQPVPVIDSLKGITYQDNVRSISFGDLECNGKMCRFQASVTKLIKDKELTQSNYFMTPQFRGTIEKTDEELQSWVDNQQVQFAKRFQKIEVKSTPTWSLRLSISKIFDVIGKVFR